MNRSLYSRVAASLVAVLATASAALAQAPAPAAPPCCEPCLQTKTICRPECATKKVTTYVYSCRCEPYCLPKCCCSGLLSKCRGCGNDCCEPCQPVCAECEHPRTKKVLLKRAVTHDEPIIKCVPECVVVPPCCPPPCYGAPVQVSPHAPAAPAKPAGELLPPPKAEGK